MNAGPRMITTLFSDMENSTPLWKNHPELMGRLIARHDAPPTRWAFQINLWLTALDRFCLNMHVTFL
jgi:hypothetical protein